MKRTLSLGVALSLIALVGCEPPTNNKRAISDLERGPGIKLLAEPVPADDSASDASLNQEPARLESGELAAGFWDKYQVEEYLTKELKLASVALISTGGNNYHGRGETMDGQTLTLRVKQIPGGIKAWHDDGQGGMGFVAFGNPVPD